MIHLNSLHPLPSCECFQLSLDVDLVASLHVEDFVKYGLSQTFPDVLLMVPSHGIYSVFFFGQDPTTSCDQTGPLKMSFDPGVVEVAR